MRLIFCADPWNERQIDEAFRDEFQAAQQAGLACSFINFEALSEQNNAARAIRRVETTEAQELALYRGWMLKPEQYEQLYLALIEKNLRLINTPEAYRHCHYLPETYPILRNHTPLTAWLRTGPEVAIDDVMALLQPFGERAVIVKDFVKSRKHEWFEACYIPSAADRDVVERVVKRFVELQGPDLSEGLVFREFIEFEQIGHHPKSGMPLSKEVRLFLLGGQVLLTSAYWDVGSHDLDLPPMKDVEAVARQVQSRFFTLDMAQRRDGSWLIVEPGDGQVAGLPERADVKAFYQKLAHYLP